MWVCGSTRPGVTSLPPRSQVLPAPAAGASAARPIQAILPPAMPIAPSGTRPNGLSPSIVATLPFFISRSNAMCLPPKSDHRWDRATPWRGPSKDASSDRHRFGERRQFHHLLVPGGEFGMTRPPRFVGVTEIEVAERAADGDL